MRGGSLVQRARLAPPIAQDAAVALGLLAVAVIDFALTNPRDLGDLKIGPASILLVAIAATSLLLRRRSVWVTFVVFQLCAVTSHFAHVVGVFGIGGLLLATVVVYSVAERSRAWASALAGVVETIVFLYYAFGPPATAVDLVSGTMFLATLFGLAWFAGLAQRRRIRLTAELEQRAADLQSERERLARQAVATERAQIARELQSLVMQGIERMTSRTERARGVLVRDPALAAEAIGGVEASGRQTLLEMRRLLGLLRRESGLQQGQTEVLRTEADAPSLPTAGMASA